MTLINLRGVSESGTIFAAPTYLFIVMALGMIGYGLFQLANGELGPDMARYQAELGPGRAVHVFEGVGLLLVLRAFAQGCAALTGTEAISDGVPAFKPPGVEERPNDADLDGRHPGGPVPGDLVPRVLLGDPAGRRGGRVGRLDDRAGGLRRGPPLLPVAGRRRC